MHMRMHDTGSVSDTLVASIALGPPALGSAALTQANRRAPLTQRVRAWGRACR